MNDKCWVALVLSMMMLAIILFMAGNAHANFEKVYLIPRDNITSEQVLNDIVVSVVKHFEETTGCLGEKEMQVAVVKEGLLIKMICICKEVKNESNNLRVLSEKSCLYSHESQNLSASN